jgi:hypothetical protein
VITREPVRRADRPARRGGPGQNHRAGVRAEAMGPADWMRQISLHEGSGSQTDSSPPPHQGWPQDRHGWRGLKVSWRDGGQSIVDPHI